MPCALWPRHSTPCIASFRLASGTALRWQVSAFPGRLTLPALPPLPFRSLRVLLPAEGSGAEGLVRFNVYLDDKERAGGTAAQGAHGGQERDPHPAPYLPSLGSVGRRTSLSARQQMKLFVTTLHLPCPHPFPSLPAPRRDQAGPAPRRPAPRPHAVPAAAQPPCLRGAGTPGSRVERRRSSSAAAGAGGALGGGGRGKGAARHGGREEMTVGWGWGRGGAAAGTCVLRGLSGAQRRSTGGGRKHAGRRQGVRVFGVPLVGTRLAGVAMGWVGPYDCAVDKWCWCSGGPGLFLLLAFVSCCGVVAWWGHGQVVGVARLRAVLY